MVYEISCLGDMEGMPFAYGDRVRLIMSVNGAPMTYDMETPTYTALVWSVAWFSSIADSNKVVVTTEDAK